MRKILALDDNPLDLECLKDTLLSVESNIVFSPTKNEMDFLNILEKEKNFSLIFVDISLGKQVESDNRGLALLEMIQQNYYHIPVCILTGFYLEKTKEVMSRFLGSCPQFVDYLDKMDYTGTHLL